jgi:cysteinyl-tRNA synthetase
LYTALKTVPAKAGDIDWKLPHAARFRDAMDDDFNTPEAIAVLFELANDVNRNRDVATATLLKSLAGVLGLLQREPAAFLQGADGTFTAEVIEQRIAARVAARKAKNFAESDRIRDELLASGIILEDGPSGTTWRRS